MGDRSTAPAEGRQRVEHSRTEARMTDDPKPALLNARCAAAFLDLSPGTLAKWRVIGKGPSFVKLGSRVAYRTNDLEDWLRARVRISTTDPGYTARSIPPSARQHP